jgi:hypothetical protein
MNNIFEIGCFPKEFNLCKLLPIIKNFNKPNDDLNNIRPISISNTIAQLFERLLLNRNYKNFNTSKNQFGFKKNSSCKLALFCIKETIIDYLEKNSECYILSLDAEKAFDKLWRDGLFYKLIKKLEKREWLILKRYYNDSEAKIICNNQFSDQFKIVTGVKQGGILSPFLFNTFIDELVEGILEMNIGANIGRINMNVISYCDDLNLIFTSAIHGQMMLDKCSSFADKWKMKFNPKKSNAIVFGNPLFKRTSFFIDNDKIDFKDKVKILGYEFNSKNINENDFLIDSFSKVRKSFFSLNKFGMKPCGLNPFLQAFIFNTFCLSKFTYAIEIMSVSNKTINFVNVMQNNLLRYLLQINKYNHLSSIQQALKIFNFKHLYYKYKLGFRVQVESYVLSKEIFDYIGTQDNKLKNSSSSYANSLNQLSILISVDRNDCGKRKKLNDQLVILNEKFNKKPEMINIVKFCLENYKIQEHRDNLRILTRFENQEELYIELN